MFSYIVSLGFKIEVLNIQMTCHYREPSLSIRQFHSLWLLQPCQSLRTSCIHSHSVNQPGLQY